MWCFKESYERSAKFVDGGTCFYFEFSRRTLQSISPAAQRVGQLREDKISDKSTIINLQKQLIDEFKEVEVKKIQDTVQSEVKTVQKYKLFHIWHTFFWP